MEVLLVCCMEMHFVELTDKTSVHVNRLDESNHIWSNYIIKYSSDILPS